MNTISGISLYLSSRKGNRQDYKVVIFITATSEYESYLPPLAISSRSAADFDHDGWYYFPFDDPIILNSGKYRILVYQQPDNIYDAPNFNYNYVDWFHSSDIESLKKSSTDQQLLSVSSDYAFGAGFVEPISFYQAIYGYGYGSGLTGSGPDYFDALGFSSTTTGYAYDEGASFYGYAYGFEVGTFVGEKTLQRTFKVHEEFNKIDLIEGGEDIYDSYIRITIPPAEAENKILNNRQDFVLATKTGVKVIDNIISLKNSGERLYSADTTSFDTSGNYFESPSVEWLKSNIFLSTNDLNFVTIYNPTGNTNVFDVKLLAAPYYSGVYLSEDGGNTWENFSEGLFDSVENNYRNVILLTISNSQAYSLIITQDSDGDMRMYRNNFDSSNWFSVSNNISIINAILFTSVSNTSSENIYIFGSDDGVYRMNISSPLIFYNFSIFINSIGHVNAVKSIGPDPDTFSSDMVIYCSDQGLHILSGSSPSTATNHAVYTDGEVYAFDVTDNGIYISTENGILRSNDDWSTLYTKYNTASATTESDFSGNSISDQNFYAFGLNNKIVNKISHNPDNHSEIYASQRGGVYISKNAGGNFAIISNSLPEKSVKNIINNPLNTRLIYALTETTKFSQAGVTFIIDSSGSMAENDPDNKRIDLAKDLISEIQSQANLLNLEAFYQIINFGISQENFSALQEGDLSGGVNNKTGGFTSNSVTASSILDSISSEGKHFRTPLYEALDISAEAINFGGVDWTYNERLKKYEYEAILSDYFSNLDKIIILITDGNNTVLSNTLNEVITNSSYKDLLGNIYVIGVGHNINYENLKSLSSINNNFKLYLGAFPENINGTDPNFASITDDIVTKEKYRSRTGNWNKIIHFNSKRKMTSVGFDANVPPNSTAQIRVRSTFDKIMWSDWTEYFGHNTDNSIDLFGNSFEINIKLTSNLSSVSPEVTEIRYSTLIPNESFGFYQETALDSGTEMLEATFTSLDDESLGNTSDTFETEFGIAQAPTQNFNYYKKLHRDKRSVISRKEYENLLYKDGYFFTTERGGWPLDYNISVYDITDGILEPILIDPDLYNAIPTLGLIVFYNKVSSERFYAIRVVPNEDVYRVGVKFTNYLSEDKEFNLYNYGLAYHKNKNSVLSRSALPYAISQLGEGDIFGFASPEIFSVSETLSTEFDIQFINKDENFRGGTISLVKGLVLDIGLDDDKYYDQNFSIASLQNIAPTDIGYISVSGPSNSVGLVTVEETFDGSINQQINIEARTLALGDSIAVRLGDTSQGGDGLPSWISMNNLLFEEGDRSISEFDTRFIFGVTSTTESPSINDTPATFIKKTTPVVKASGLNAVRLVVICPTTINAGSTFAFSVLAVDSKGFIDKNFTGDISLSIDNSQFATLNNSTYTFTSDDNGVKELGGIVSSSANGVFRVLATIDEINVTSESNPIITNFEDVVYWGDLNISTVFSEGRQDIDFIVNYAKNISRLNFISISDNLNYLNQEEFDYIRTASADSTTTDFVVLPGFKYQTKSSTGERVFVYENSFEETDSLAMPTPPNLLSSSEDQFIQITDYMENNNINYISFPIHSAYEVPDNLAESREDIFKDRNFNLENYRNIIGYNSSNSVSNQLIKDLVNEKEAGFEIYSAHGNIEVLNSNNPIPYSNINFNSSEPSYYMRHALRIGKRFGMLAGAGDYSSRPGYYVGDISKFLTSRPSANKHNKGLTAILSDSLDSAEVINAIKNRKTYATTGARMFVDFSVSGLRNGISVTEKMGSVITNFDTDGKFSSGSLIFSVRAVGDGSDITNIELIKIQVDSDSTSSDVFAKNTSTTFGRDTGVLTFEDENVTFEEVLNFEYCYYVRITQADGHILWSSPIWINYGRTDGISATSSLSNSVYGISPISLSLTSDNIDKIGNIKNIPLTVTGSTSQESFPILHNDILINNQGNPEESSRQTPYSDIFLSVGNKNPVIGGIRLLSDNNNFIAYGTHYPNFIIFPNDLSLNIDSSLSQNIINPDPQSQYKTLNEPERNIDRIKFYRNYLFGTMWQYTSSSYTESFNLEFNTVYNPDEFINIVKEPHILRENDTWRLVYSSFRSAYPESSISKIDILNRNSDSVDRDKIEEFAGLLEGVNVEGVLNSGASFRIVYADNIGLSGRNFARKYIVPNIISNTSKQIYYASSPNLLKINDAYRIYFLGWINSNSSPSKPLMGMFYCDFEDFEDIPNSAVKVAFLFSSDQNDYITNYVSRKCNFNSGNFMSQETRIMGAQGWPAIHPAYSIPWNWLSVVQRDGGFFYATINFMNTLENVSNSNSININGADNPGTLVLYSVDGNNFYNFDKETETQQIPNILNKLYVTPFKISEKWFISYREINDFSNLYTNSKNWPLRYGLINWSLLFSENSS